MNEVLNPTDHLLAQKAHQDLIKANGTWEFVHNHLVQTYQIQPGDSVDIATGVISRAPRLEETEVLKANGKKRKERAIPEVTD